MTPYKVDFDSIPWEMPAERIRYKGFSRNGKQLRLVEMFRGYVEADWCMKGHIGCVLEGRMEADFQGGMVIYEKGDGIFILAGEGHKAKVLTDVVRLVLVEEM